MKIKLSKSNNLPNTQPIYQTSSFCLPNMDAWEAYMYGQTQDDVYVYGTDGNPSVQALEAELSLMTGCEAALATSSARSALSYIIFSLAQSGDRILIPKECYRSSRFFTKTILPKFGVDVVFYDLEDVDSLIELAAEGSTKIILIESPSNPMTRIADLSQTLEICKEVGAISVLDYSLGGLHAMPILAEYDVCMQSLTKYATANGEVMAGVLHGKEEWIHKIRRTITSFRDTLDPAVAVQILNGLTTFDLRYKTQSESALQIAKFLESHAAVSRVIYPGLESHPDYDHAKEYLKYPGTILSFDLRLSHSEIHAFLDRLKHFKLCFGAGYSFSIASPAKLFYEKGFVDDLAHGASSITEGMVRLSIGIESPDVLIEDLKSSLHYI